MVGDALFNFGTFVKSFASELRNVQVSGSKLGELPGLKQTLEYMANMELKRENLQIGVNQASTALTGVVRRNGSLQQAKAPPPASSSSSSTLPGYLTLGLLVAVPTSIYLYMDADARGQAHKYTQQALEQAKKGMQSIQTAAQDEAYRKQLLLTLQHDVEEAQVQAAKYYAQGKGVAKKQFEALLKLIQEQLIKAGVSKESKTFKLFDTCD